MPTRRDVVRLSLASAALLLPTFGNMKTAMAKTSLDGDEIKTSAGSLIIHPVNHASLLLGFGDEVIYVDPVGGAARYEGLPRPTAILLTHEHPDHFDVPTLEGLGGKAPIFAPKSIVDALPAALKAGATALANGETGTIAGVSLTAIPAYNLTPDRLTYHPKGDGNGYVLTFGDKKIYIAGDTEDTPEMRALTGIDVAFLPMNLPYTMTEAQAADAVKAFKPHIVYPYHYKGSDPKIFAAKVGNVAEVRLVDWYKK